MGSRGFAVVLLVGGLLVGCGQATEPAGTSPEKCQRQWADLAQLHGENGNPVGPVADLADRWEELDDEAHRLMTTADGDDCGDRIEQHAREWDGLESFQYDLQAFDLPHRLELGEADLVHWVGLREEFGEDPTPPPEIRKAFRTLRREAPRAADDLAPVLADADEIDVTDEDEKSDFVAEVARAAADSAAYAAGEVALRRIGQAELHEE